MINYSWIKRTKERVERGERGGIFNHHFRLCPQHPQPPQILTQLPRYRERGEVEEQDLGKVNKLLQDNLLSNIVYGSLRQGRALPRRTNSLDSIRKHFTLH